MAETHGDCVAFLLLEKQLWSSCSSALPWEWACWPSACLSVVPRGSWLCEVALSTGDSRAQHGPAGPGSCWTQELLKWGSDMLWVSHGLAKAYVVRGGLWGDSKIMPWCSIGSAFNYADSVRRIIPSMKTTQLPSASKNKP